MNRFQCSIPYFEGHLMLFKIRYKATHNYDPVKFYELNHFCCQLVLQGGAKNEPFFHFFQKFTQLTKNCSFTDVNKEKKTRNRKKLMKTSAQRDLHFRWRRPPNASCFCIKHNGCCRIFTKQMRVFLYLLCENALISCV